MQRAVRFEDSIEHALATRFDASTEALMGSNINVVQVAGACTSLLTTYLQYLPPTDRILVLNEIVESILSGINDSYTNDIILN